jgi:hypothetical protein
MTTRACVADIGRRADIGGQDDPLAPFRGITFGILISLPIDVLLLWLVVR